MLMDIKNIFDGSLIILDELQTVQQMAVCTVCLVAGIDVIIHV